MASILRRSSQVLWKCKPNLRWTSSKTGEDKSYFEDDPQLASGKTEVRILNHEQDAGIFMDAFSNIGFKLSNGLRIMGPCAVFPRSILHWNVRGAKDINEDSLSLFTLLEPKIDILVMGVGERENLQKVDSRITSYLRSKRISLEMLTTEQALPTFNFLNSEKRYVAGAFIPPAYITDIDEADAYQSMLSHNQTQEYWKTDWGEMPEESEEDKRNNERYIIGSGKTEVGKSLKNLKDSVYHGKTKSKKGNEPPDDKYRE